MARPLAFAALAGAAALAACGARHEPPSPLCTAGAETIERALAHAGDRRAAPVRLADGTPLSECVARARSDAQLQEMGLVLTRAADHLALRAGRQATAATALGYLVGAARRGAAHTSGIHTELVRRLEQSAAFLEGADRRSRAALRRGLVAGEAMG